MRKLSKTEFVEKMLAAQEERKAKAYAIRDNIFQYFKVKDLRFLRAQGKNKASSFNNKKGGRIR